MRPLAGLVSKHSGDLVELDLRCAGWQLRAVAPGSASGTLPPHQYAQWFCPGNGEPVGNRDFEFGYPGGSGDTSVFMHHQVADTVGKYGICPHALYPDWDVQAIPCAHPLPRDR